MPEDQPSKPAPPKQKKEKINHHQLISRNTLPFLLMGMVIKKKR
jgi:hypothetical protein